MTTQWDVIQLTNSRIITILGDNGSGKSTLLKALSMFPDEITVPFGFNSINPFSPNFFIYALVVFLKILQLYYRTSGCL